MTNKTRSGRKTFCAYPDCGKTIPATYGVPGVSMSRLDNKTLICSECGMREALQPNIMKALEVSRSK